MTASIGIPGFEKPNRAFTITPFTRLARAHALSTAADAMVTVSLAGTIFFEGATSDARGRVFWYLLLTMAPFAVIAPLIGPALDRARSGRRWIVIGACAGRGLLCTIMIGRTDSITLYPAAFGVLVLQKAYGIARSSLVPSVVSSDEALVQANSKLQLIGGLMAFMGAAPAALLYRIFGQNPSAPLVLAVLVFVAASSLAVRIPKVAVATEKATAEERAELRSPGVLLAGGGMGLLRGIVGFLTLFFAFHFRSKELLAFGIVGGFSMAGTLLGSVLAPRLRELWKEERMLISSLLLALGAGIAASLVGGVGGAALVGGCLGVSSTAGKLAFDSIVQRDAPDANRGRLFARFETRFQVIWVIGSMLGLLPLSSLRVAFLMVSAVAGFAAFSYVIGLSAWQHRTGASSSPFGQRAAAIDDAIEKGQAKAKDALFDSTRAVGDKLGFGGDKDRQTPR